MDVKVMAAFKGELQTISDELRGGIIDDSEAVRLLADWALRLGRWASGDDTWEPSL